MTTPDEVPLGPAARLGVALARADLGYVRAAIEPGHVERALAFAQYAVLVAFEAHAFGNAQLRLALPDLAWNPAIGSGGP